MKRPSVLSVVGVAVAMSVLLACRRGAPLQQDATAVTRLPPADAGGLPGDAALLPVMPVIPVVLEPEPAPDEADPTTNEDAGAPENVRLQVRVGPVDAEVFWGVKRLGVVKRAEPLEIVRPKHSGPMDLVIRAAGFVPHHTRLFTDRDDRVTIDLVRPSAAPGLVEWKVKAPATRLPPR